MNQSEDAAELRYAANSLMQAASDLRAAGGQHSTATINQNPGNALVVTCAVLVGMNVMLAAMVGLIGLRVFDLDDKLSAVYMMAPHLNPDNKK